ncbi:MAG: hypothetical protein FWD68_01365 [Alphaproteobacteria bacterium]|nr:hypothetical protein [Alphaproteobacteria bacterium]
MSDRISAEALVRLGAERLADILVTFSERDSFIRERLQSELLVLDGMDILAANVRSNLHLLGKIVPSEEWHNRARIVARLELQLEVITERIAPARPDLALELLWQYVPLMDPLVELEDDGEIGMIFHDAVEAMAGIAIRARPDPVALAERIFAAMAQAEYRQFDRLFPAILPALGERGLVHLKKLLHDGSGQGSGIAGSFRRVLTRIADGEGDVDAFIALTSPEERRSPQTAVAIARRLLAVGRGPEAVSALLLVPCGKGEAFEYGAWSDAYIDALEASDQRDKAQDIRFESFRRHLHSDRLRKYLELLPPSQAAAAEDEALNHVLKFDDAMSALDFFGRWSDVERAATLILKRHSEVTRGPFFPVDDFLEKLGKISPLAAVVVRRAAIRTTLEESRRSRYEEAADHLFQCRELHKRIIDYQGHVSHGPFLAGLRADHGRKHAFWGYVRKAGMEM